MRPRSGALKYRRDTEQGDGVAGDAVHPIRVLMAAVLRLAFSVLLTSDRYLYGSVAFWICGAPIKRAVSANS